MIYKHNISERQCNNKIFYFNTAQDRIWHTANASVATGTMKYLKGTDWGKATKYFMYLLFYVLRHAIFVLDVGGDGSSFRTPPHRNRPAVGITIYKSKTFRMRVMNCVWEAVARLAQCLCRTLLAFESTQISNWPIQILYYRKKQGTKSKEGGIGTILPKNLLDIYA